MGYSSDFGKRDERTGELLNPDDAPIVNNFQANEANLDHTAYGSAINRALGTAADTGRSDSIDQQQSALARQLQAQSLGSGPNLAQTQLERGTQLANNSAASAVASQRGLNPQLAARQILSNQASNNQNMAGQSAQLRQQFQLDTQQQLLAALEAQRQQNLAQQQTNIGLLGTTGGLQNNQNTGTLQNSLGTQKINAEVAQQNQQAASDNQRARANNEAANAASKNALVGGIISGVTGTIAGPAAAGAWSNIGGKATGAGNTPNTGSTSVTDTNTGAAVDGADTSAPSASDFNKGGMVKHYADGGEADNSGMDFIMKAAPLILALLGHGGKVPGKAKVQTDSLKNDIVPAMLSPGEIVIPRSIADNPELAKEFVKAINKKARK